MSDFSDRPFVAGSLTGLRAFDVDTLGRLVGPSFPEVFKPGENEARCRGGSFARQIRAVNAALSRQLSTMTFAVYPESSTTFTAPPSPPRITAPPLAESEDSEPESELQPQHVLGGVDCTCGYYAYFDGGNDLAASDRVSALIEGYGVCTVGDRGFRASKARLVALVDPSPPRRRSWRHPAWYDRLSDHLGRHHWAAPVGVLSLALGVMGIIVGIGLAVEYHTAFASLSVPSAGALAWCGVLLKADFHAIDRRHASVSDMSRCAIRPQGTSGTSFALVRRNYPDVPVYPTVRAALAAHPLTPPPGPPEPTPDDEDFWTRSAS